MTDRELHRAFPAPSPAQIETALGAVVRKGMARSARRRRILRAAAVVVGLGGAFGAGVWVGAAGNEPAIDVPAAVDRSPSVELIVRAPVLEPGSMARGGVP